MKFVIAVACFSLLLSYAAPAEERRELDRVVRRLPGGGQVAVRGIIEDYNADRLLLSTTTGEEVQNYPADQIVEVETPQSANYIQGLAHYREGRFEEAETYFSAALHEESRPNGRGWLRREILAMLIRSALQQGDRATARARFELLIQAEPQTRFFSLIPLTWDATPVDPGESLEARAMLGSNLAGSRLMGASVLLLDPKFGRFAAAELDRLAANADRRIRHLASSQRWRTILLQRPPTDLEIGRWAGEIKKLPAELRGGPYYVLGQAHHRRDELSQSAAALLWVPLVYDQDAVLAARSLVEAADALRRQRKLEQAVRLYREAVARFPRTEHAQDAEAALEELLRPQGVTQ